MTAGTLYFYQKKLELFTRFCDGQQVSQIDQVDPVFLRRYLLWLEETGHNPGGIHAAYRVVKTFLRWWAAEVEPVGWKNPIEKVKPPKVGIEPLDPVNFEDVKAMMATCDTATMTGARDKAILQALLDTGTRAAEFVSMNLEDTNQVTGAVLIRQGKGRKSRTVYMGAKTRKALRKYLHLRKDNHTALWVTDEGERLTYWGLNEIIRRRALVAGVKKPELHSFRRAFALAMLRNGTDVFTLQQLTGHADLQVLRRYLKQTDQDTAEAHKKGSPVDKLY